MEELPLAKENCTNNKLTENGGLSSSIKTGKEVVDSGRCIGYRQKK